MGGQTRFDNIITNTVDNGQAVDKLAAAYDKLSASIDGAVKTTEKVKPPAFEAFAANVKRGIQDPFTAAGEGAEAFLNKLGPMGAGISVAAAAFGGATMLGMKFARELGGLGDQIEDTAARMGLSVKETGQFSFAMKYAGGEIGSLEGIMRRLSPEIESGGQNLRKMGVETRDAYGQMRPMSEIVAELGERLRAIPNVADRNTAAIKVMGRGALEVLPDLMGFSEGLRKAREYGFGPSEADVAQWAEYRQKMVLVDAAWDRLVNKLKGGVVATVGIIVKPVKAGAEGQNQALADLFNRPSDDFDKALTEGLRENLKTRTAKDLATMRSADPRFAQSRSAVSAALNSTPEAEIAAAKQKLDDLRKKLAPYAEMEVLPSVTAPLIRDVQAQEQVVARLEAAMKRRQDLMAKGRSLAAFERKVMGLEMGPGEKLFAEAGELGWDPASRERAWSAALRGAVTEVEKQEEQYKAVDIPGKAAERWAKQGEAVIKEMDASTSKFVQAWLAQTKPIAAANRQIEDILFGSERAEIIARSGKASRMAELAAGPGQEASAINAAYRERLGLAQQLFDLDMQRAAAEADINQQRVDTAKAEADLHRETYEADIERELKLAELRRKGLDEWKSLAVGGFQALVAGGGGLSSFAKAQAMALGSKLVGNAAGMTYGAVQGKLTLPGQGTADNPTWLGNLLNGTPLGLDPLKGATDANTMATVENTAALRSLAMGGGGGGFGGGGGWWSESGEWMPDESGPGGAGAASSGTAKWGKYLGLGAAIAGGGFGIYSGVRSGGARGALTAGGSAAAMAGAILPLISKSLNAAGPIGMAVGMGLGLLTMALPNPKEERAREIDRQLEAARYTGPSAMTYAMDRYGRAFDTNTRGEIRIVVETPVTVNAMDAKSFGERSVDIAEAHAAVLEAHLSPRVEAAIRGLMARR